MESRPEYFENRELSWLKFDLRCLNEARDKSIPLLERAKFISITSSNLDEFFMVRVASLMDQVHAKYKKADFAGLTPTMQLAAINKATREMVDIQYETYNDALIPALEKNGIYVIEDINRLNTKQLKQIDKYFDEVVYPVLTPMAVDSGRPFPLILNKTLNIAALIKRDGEKEFATVQVPSVLGRLVEVDPDKNEGQDHVFVLLEQVIMRNFDKLFIGCTVRCTATYRVMRNADLGLDEEEAHDLLKEIEKQLKKRQWGEVIRLEVSDDVDKKLLKSLITNLATSEENVYRIKGPIDLTYTMKLYGIDDKDKLKNKPYTPQPVPAIGADDNIFEAIKRGDILMHHPYETFDPVVDFIRTAANDPDVLAIKQTLYRVSGNSPIIAALATAAEKGKQVTVLVELKARFDEEHNIVWARKLEQAGCHVIYGLVGLKTHSKIALVVRKEAGGITRYVHLGTGNYNDSTAKLYTDLGIFTCNNEIGEDATAVFNMLSGFSQPAGWNHLFVAPVWLRDNFVRMIRREANNAKAGKRAIIKAKMNSLCDEGIINELYEASKAGVKIELIVRGICCLRTGIKGVSENISVRSIVGNFLEHSRIFYFYNDADEEVYMGSADWMPRNLDRRVEIVFPVLDEQLKKRVMEIVDLELKDNVKANILGADGNYYKPDRGDAKKIDSQEMLCKQAIKAAKPKKESADNRVFIPITGA